MRSSQFPVWFLWLTIAVAYAYAGKTPPADPKGTDAHTGLSPKEAARAMSVPEGFSVTLVAGEPDVRQPIAMAIDDRGRLWIAEAYSYPVRLPDEEARDRILIFEDSDGDGRFDNSQVFIDKLNLVSGMEVGFGGVWVGSAPYLLFIPDRDGDDRPDGPPQVLLDGWGYQDTHETLNAFIWGPDGWLYGCHGVFTHSRVGKPGTPDISRVPLNAGIWRYHPTKHRFEVFAHGTSNPWGVDFNDYGQAFCTACVIPHLFHVFQGARYHRQAGRHFNSHTYDDIKTIADHLHYAGNIREHAHWGWTPTLPKSTAAAGGGHAHAGAMIYLGDAWPARYRNRIFMNNVHGARINMDLLERQGSGYVGRHGQDFLLANDLFSQIINLRYGPDGQVYMIDWYDKNQCHRREYNIHDRSNGRIFKVSYQGALPVQVDLKKLSDLELVRLQLHRNDWYVRHARRILQERAAGDGTNREVHQALERLAFDHPDPTRRLRGLWALHVTGGLNGERAWKGLNNENAFVRAWTIQLVMEDKHLTSEILQKFVQMARHDPSPVVRLYLASALGRLPYEQRWEIVEGLCSHAEDARDHNLPLLYWYGAEPLAPRNMSRALELAMGSKIPPMLEFMVRRIASIGNPEALALLVRALGRVDSQAVQLNFLQGISQAVKGRRNVPMPKGWPAAFRKLTGSGDSRLRYRATALAVTFGDPRAFQAMRKILRDSAAVPAERQGALTALLEAKDRELAPVLQGLVADRVLRRKAIRGLAAYDDPQTPSVILQAYNSFSPAERRDALNTLASRASYAKALLAAIADKRVSASDLSADIIRQMRNLQNEAITRQIARVWGVVRETAADKARLIARYKALVSARTPREPDLSLGRAVYAKTCQQCHILFGAGGTVGPELTGSNRRDLDYALSNVLDPGAVMAKEYLPSIIATADGRVITGIVRNQDRQSVTVQTANETVTLPGDEIEAMKLGTKSMMPDDLLGPLSDHEVRALFAYLASPMQVPMLAAAENVTGFFTGQDLAGWDGDSQLWRAEDGQIVGRSPGLGRCEFLRSHLAVEDFHLKLKVKLLGNRGNSGIQFRSEVLPDGQVKGYQAGIGPGRWGNLYEEHGRGPLEETSGDAYVKPGEWNTYEIIAVGSRIRTFINRHLCADLNDPVGKGRGIIALDLGSGGPTEVRFKDLKLELKPAVGRAASSAGPGR